MPHFVARLKSSRSRSRRRQPQRFLLQLHSQFLCHIYMRHMLHNQRGTLHNRQSQAGGTAGNVQLKLRFDSKQMNE